MTVAVEVARSDLAPTRPRNGANERSVDHAGPVHFPERGLTISSFATRCLLIIGVIVGVVAKPLPVISNAVPVLLAPPVFVVPKRSPFASATKLAPNPAFAAPLKSATMVGVLCNRWVS